jgi:hypothetical protein
MVDLSMLPWWFWALVIGGVIVLIWFWKGTSMDAGKYRKVGAIMLFGGLIAGIVFYPAAFGLDEVGVQTVVTPDELETDYSIQVLTDATPATISSDFSLSDDAVAGEFATTNDEEGNTASLSLTNTCTALGACTWDVFSFTFTVTAEFPSEWSDGARKTAVLGVRIDNSLLSWGVASNNTAGNPIVPFVARDPRGNSGFVFVDGAAANKGLADTDVQSINEFSPGESITSAGIYWETNEADYSADYRVPTGIWTWNGDLEFYDDYGFSHIVDVTLTLTTA